MVYVFTALILFFVRCFFSFIFSRLSFIGSNVASHLQPVSKYSYLHIIHQLYDVRLNFSETLTKSIISKRAVIKIPGKSVGLKYRRKSAKFGNKLRISVLCKEQQLLPNTHVGLATHPGRMETAFEMLIGRD